MRPAENECIFGRLQTLLEVLGGFAELWHVKANSHIAVYRYEYEVQSMVFFLFLKIFIQNMQFIYTDICLNNLRYELHKLHFPNFSRLLRPPMARAQTTLYIKKKQQKTQQFLILYLDPCHK